MPNETTNEETTLLDEIKIALRVTHTKLDGEISDNILAAEHELERVGIPWEIASDPENHPLIKRAVKTYCQSAMAIDQAQAEKYQRSFELQAENMRKTQTLGELGGDAE